eukprot:13664579-Ditylum_brightwellii.AAC.1
MLKDGKKKGEFLINNVGEEKNKILDCDSDIGGEEKDDLHLMTDVSNEVQQKFKEDEEAAMDDPWVHGVLAKKAGETNIKQFTIPDQWEPPAVKGGQPNFTELDSTGDWPEFCYCLSFKKD